jgi:hypothetical protein
MKKQVKLKNNNLKMAGNLYLPDGMDAKLTAFFGNNIFKKDISFQIWLPMLGLDCGKGGYKHERHICYN